MTKEIPIKLPETNWPEYKLLSEVVPLNDFCTKLGQAAPNPGSDVWRVPWLTPVLGQECLESVMAREKLNLEVFARVLVDYVWEVNGSSTADSQKLIEYCRPAKSSPKKSTSPPVNYFSILEFVISLVEDRCDSNLLTNVNDIGLIRHHMYDDEDDNPYVKQSTSPEEPESVIGIEHEGELALIYVAGLLNRAYYHSRFQIRPSLSRWDEIPIRVDQLLRPVAFGKQAGDGSKIDIDYVELAKPLIDYCMTCWPKSGRALPASTFELLRSMKTGLTSTPPMLRLSDLRNLTETCWQTLMRPYPAVLGWPELNLRLSRRDGGKLAAGSFPKARFDSPKAATAAIRSALDDDFLKSAEVSFGEETEDNIYDQYARVLWSLAEVRHKHEQLRIPDHYPPVQQSEDVEWRASNESGADDWAPDDIDGVGEDRQGYETAVSEKSADTSSVKDDSPRTPHDVDDRPSASAFSTTFDLNLELALAKAARKSPSRVGFIIAFPVYNSATDSSDYGNGVWIGRFVDLSKATSPVELVTSITGRAVSSDSTGLKITSKSAEEKSPWFVLSRLDQCGFDGTFREISSAPLNEYKSYIRDRLPHEFNLSNLPIVVHLMGCPLVRVPTLTGDSELLRDLLWTMTGTPTKTEDLRKASAGASDDDKKRDGKQQKNQTTLQHAILFSENHVMRWSIPSSMDTALTTTLPTPLLGDGFNGDYWRYWLFSGVSVGDSAVRYRVITELIGAGLITNSPPPKLRGVAVNRDPIGYRATETLLTEKVEVAHGGLDQLTLYLDHYLFHLKEAIVALDENRPVVWPIKDADVECKWIPGGVQ